MKTKRFITALLILTLALGSLPAFAAAPPGSAEDPLISKSYADSTYPSLVLNAPVELLKNSMAVLEYKLKSIAPSGNSGDTIRLLPAQSTLYLSVGSGFTLLSGGGMLVDSGKSLLDLTTAQEISNGQPLSKNHRYLSVNGYESVTLSSASLVKLSGSVQVTAGEGLTFTDVTPDKWFYNDVAYAVKKGLVEGRSPTTYAPDASLSIAEAIKLAACMHQLYNSGTVTLKDDPALWYKSYVDYASQNGIVTKVYKNYDAKILRGEFVSIFYAALPASQYTAINTVADNAIPDVKLTDSYAGEIYAFYRAGIVVGKEEGVFFPNSEIKRSEVAAILTRMFEKDSRQPISFNN